MSLSSFYLKADVLITSNSCFKYNKNGNTSFWEVGKMIGKRL